MFYSFMNFFAIFLEFSISGRVGIERDDNFYFLSFSSFRNLFWLEKKALIVFSNFMNFFAIFLEFSISGGVGIDWNDNFYFHSFSAFPPLFWLEEKLQSCFIVV